MNNTSGEIIDREILTDLVLLGKKHDVLLYLHNSTISKDDNNIAYAALKIAASRNDKAMILILREFFVNVDENIVKSIYTD